MFILVSLTCGLCRPGTEASQSYRARMIDVQLTDVMLCHTGLTNPDWPASEAGTWPGAPRLSVLFWSGPRYVFFRKLPLCEPLISAESPTLVLSCFLIFPSRLRTRKQRLLQGCQLQRKQMLTRKMSFKQRKRCVACGGPRRFELVPFDGTVSSHAQLSQAGFHSQFLVLKCYEVCH